MMSASTPTTLRKVLVSTALATTCGPLPAFLVASQAVQIEQDLDFGPALLGATIAISFVVAALFSTSMGGLTERLGGSRSLRYATFLNATVMLTIAVAARSWWMLAVLAAVAGLGNALTQPAANVLMARTIPPERHGIAFAIKQSAMPFAALVGGAAVPLVTLTLGWRWTFVFAGLAAVAAGATLPDDRRVVRTGGVSAAAAPQAPPVPPPPAGAVRRTSARARLDTPLPVLLVLAAAVAFGASVASAQVAFLVSGAVEAGVAEGAAGLLLTFGSALGIVSRLANGVRADRRGGRHLPVVALMLCGGAAAYVLYAVQAPWAYLVATPLAFAAGWAWPGLFNLAVVRANPRAPGLATAITQTGTYVGAGFGPLLFGVVAAGAGYGWAWLGATGAALVAAALTVLGRSRLRRRRGSIVGAPPARPAH
jgi:MFS family permease